MKHSGSMLDHNILVALGQAVDDVTVVWQHISGVYCSATLQELYLLGYGCVDMVALTCSLHWRTGSCV